MVMVFSGRAGGFAVDECEAGCAALDGSTGAGGLTWGGEADCMVALATGAGVTSGPREGGSSGADEPSWGKSDGGTGRVTMTVSPASLATPPAWARTSSKVTGPSAWLTIGRITAPTTVMGLLLRSFTLTVTSG